MDGNPKEVLRVAIPESLRASMPPAVRASVEEQVELEGTLEILHEDRDTGSRCLYFLEVGGDRYTLRFASEPPTNLLTGSRIRVKGIRLGKDIVL